METYVNRVGYVLNGIGNLRNFDKFSKEKEADIRNHHSSLFSDKKMPHV